MRLMMMLAMGRHDGSYAANGGIEVGDFDTGGGAGQYGAIVQQTCVVVGRPFCVVVVALPRHAWVHASRPLFVRMPP